MLRPQASEIVRACSHQCFKRSPCPVPAAVWVLLGKLAMACKLGTPPHPARLCHLLSPLQAQPLETDPGGAGHPALLSRSPRPCGLSQGRVFCFRGCDKAIVSLPAWSGFPGCLLGPGLVVSTS